MLLHVRIRKQMVFFVLNIYILLLKIIQNQEASLYKALLFPPKRMKNTKIPSCVQFQGRLVTRGLSCITTLPLRVSGIILLLLKASQRSVTPWLLNDGRGRHSPAPWAAKKRNTATLIAAMPIFTASMQTCPCSLLPTSPAEQVLKR